MAILIYLITLRPASNVFALDACTYLFCAYFYAIVPTPTVPVETRFLSRDLDSLAISPSLSSQAMLATIVPVKHLIVKKC